MRGKKTKSIIIGSVVTMLLSVVSYGYNLDIVGENLDSEIKPGDSVIVSIKIKELDSEGVNVYSGQLEYDNNIFEQVTQDNFKFQNTWDNLTYNQENGIFIVENNNKVTLDEDIMKIELKSKSNINEEEAIFSVKNNVVSGGNEDIKIDDKDVTIMFDITDDDKNTSSDDKNDDKDDEIKFEYDRKDNCLININPKTPINVFKENVLSNVEKSVKIYKDDKEVVSGYIETGMKIKIFDEQGNSIKDADGNELEYELSVIGDVNGDGLANKIDSNLIKSFRNEIIKLENAYFESADINRDGSININDTKLLLYHRAEIKGYCLNYSK